MTGEDLIDSLEYVDEEIVEEALNCSCIKKRWYRPVLAMAACLAVVLAIGMWNKREQKPELTAALVWDAFEGQDKGIAGDEDRTFYAYAMKGYQPLLGALPTTATVPFYQRNTEESIVGSRPLYQQRNQILQRLCEALWIDVPEELPVADQYGYRISNDANGLYYYEYFSVQRSDRAEIAGDYSVQLDGNKLTVDLSKSDEEIISLLEPVKQRLFEIFEVELPDVRVNRTESSYRIHYFDNSAHPLNELEEIPVTDRITIEFSGRNVHQTDVREDMLIDSKITYYRYLLKPDVHYPAVGECNLISFDDAKQKLAQGHSFGGVCKQCVETSGSSCNHYEYVSFEYFSAGSRNENLYIPVYAFWFKNYERDNSVFYRVLYVCAADVEGLDRYFEEKNN